MGINDALKGNLKGLPQETLNRIESLQHDLTALGNNTNPAEARRLAETGILYSLYLAYEYRIIKQPHFHNILVNIGLKDRGLCFQWAEDLMKQFKTLNLKTFNLYEAVADKGKKFREHNTIVVTAKGKDFFEGIVLDPWRDSGDLYWISVKEDKYHWEKR
ncbi:MAG: hypothetical protein JW927_23010 [Deltaproteobacteria bacterium]|nr:hypothetical protein [Deltaproteobacteria bacterium]